MSVLDARSHYRRAETGVPVSLENPHQIIQVALRELEKSLEVLGRSQSEGLPLPATHMNRAFTAVYILQSSLDFEQGGEIAENLFKVYEYIRQKLLAAFRKEANEGLSQAAEFLHEIVVAWDAIAPV